MAYGDADLASASKMDVCDSGLRPIHSEHFPDDSELFRNGHESHVRIIRAKETQLPGCLCEIKKQTSLFLK